MMPLSRRRNSTLHSPTFPSVLIMKYILHFAVLAEHIFKSQVVIFAPLFNIFSSRGLGLDLRR